MFDLARVAANFEAVLLALDDGVWGQRAHNRVGLEVAEKLRPLHALHVVQLRELSVPEESVATAAVNTLDVHTESHYDLVVTVGTGVVLDAHFDSLV